MNESAIGDAKLTSSHFVGKQILIFWVDSLQELDIVWRMELGHLDRVCLVWTLSHINSETLNQKDEETRKMRETNINFHLAMEAIGKDKMMGHTKPVRFHWVIRTKIDAPYISCNSEKKKKTNHKSLKHHMHMEHSYSS